jgi:CRP/FNR family transcriptional regulator
MMSPMQNIRDHIASALRKAQLFAGLSPAEMEALASRSLRKIYASGETVFNEGDACEGLYVVSRGHVRIIKISASGREQVLAVEGPGGSVAELPVFDGGRYPATVVAVDDAELIFVSRQAFQAFCLEHPEVALKVLAVVGARLRRLVGIIEELSFTTVRQRLIAALMRMAEAASPNGTSAVFDLPGSHQELAHQMGTVREIISRSLTRLQAEGLIRFDGRHVEVPDIHALVAAGDQQ